jgi:pimeloyl-ACP methyl ester carboxylesterase
MVVRGTRAGTTPVVYLEGGPGGAAIANVAALFEYFAPILTDHDLVVFDQRGTGFSEPSLSCPELAQAETSALPPEEQRVALLDALQSCHGRVVQSGHDPSKYTSRNNAADVDALRQALGYPAWHLFGVSYGTRLALDVLRYHASGVASAVIDSVLPPQVDFASLGAVHTERALDEIFAACEAMPKCAAAYPDLEGVLFRTVTELDAAPETLTLPDGASATVTGNAVLSLLFMLSYSAEAITYFPEIIYQFAEREWRVLEAFLGGGAAEEGIATGMYLSVVCSEYVAYSSIEKLEAANASVEHPVLAEVFGSSDIFDYCAAWNVPPAAPTERDAVTGDVHTLVLSGRFDPVTPPAWGSLAAGSLSRSFDLVYQDQSHGVFSGPCGSDLLKQFWSSPGSDPSFACPPDERTLVFYVAPTRSSSGTSLRSYDVAPLVLGIPPDVLERARRWFR